MVGAVFHSALFCFSLFFYRRVERLQRHLLPFLIHYSDRCPGGATAICEHKQKMRRKERTQEVWANRGQAGSRNRSINAACVSQPSTARVHPDVPVPRSCPTEVRVHSVCVTPPPVSLLHVSFLLIVPCFCLTDAPFSKDVCLAAALQIGHALSIPLPATLEGRQPARSCVIYRHQNSFPLWRLSLLVLCYNRTHHRRTVCFDVTFEHFVEARQQRFTGNETAADAFQMSWISKHATGKDVSVCSCRWSFLWTLLYSSVSLWSPELWLISYFANTSGAPARGLEQARPAERSVPPPGMNLFHFCVICFTFSVHESSFICYTNLFKWILYPLLALKNKGNFLDFRGLQTWEFNPVPRLAGDTSSSYGWTGFPLLYQH